MRQGSLLGAVLVFCSVVLATAVGTPVPALAQGAAEDCLAPPPKNQDLTLVAAYAASPPAVDEVAFTMETENLMALTYGGDLVQYKVGVGGTAIGGAKIMIVFVKSRGSRKWSQVFSNVFPCSTPMWNTTTGAPVRRASMTGPGLAT